MKHKPTEVRIVLGSETDAPYGNMVIEIFRAVGVTYGVSFASCHRDGGSDFENFGINQGTHHRLYRRDGVRGAGHR